jgi:ATP:ADP antiporter, AAA family
MTAQTSDFKGFKAIFWPIHNFELKKFLPMVVIIACFLYNYTIMRDTKDTLIVTAAGAEVIPFLKFWGTLPMSILFIIVYAKLSNILKTETLFQVIVLPFLIFFLLFGFVLYPYKELFQPNGTADFLIEYITVNFPASMHPTSLKLVEVFRNWIYAIFYILAELWGSMGISLLFWQFANEITKTSEAKRFYPFFILLGNLGALASGLSIIYFSNIRNSVPVGVDAWGVTLKWLMGALSLGCVIIMATYYWMNRNVLTDSRFYDAAAEKKQKKSKPKLSLKESFTFLISNKYLGSLALLVIGYGISINIIEVVWKSQLKIQYPNENDYSAFMGAFSSVTALTTILFIFIGSNILRRIGWLAGALASPIILILTGGTFFAFTYFRHELGGYLPWTALFITVIAGAAQNILAKSTKYSLFDPTKEMAYIPLDQESKVKGKAAIDVVGARLGKSGGGLVLQGVFLTMGLAIDNLITLITIVGVVVFLWMRSVFSLNKQYTAKIEEQQKEAEQKA